MAIALPPLFCYTIAMNYLFGPVASRRLGRSLGVDLLPFKTCTLDCVFCECGGTTACTALRAEHVPVDAVMAEMRAWLDAGGTADMITLAGSGEPTLHTRFGDIIRAIKAATPIPVCLLTNGTLLHLPEVRRDAMLADVVVPSLNAADEATFVRICRPCGDCTFEKHVAGLRAFAAEYKGEFWLEVFVVPGINDDVTCMRRIAALAAELKPRKIQLNTAVRPPAVESVTAAPAGTLERLAPLFTPQAEIVASHRGGGKATPAGSDEAVLQLLERRPGTMDDIAHGLGIAPAKAAEIVERLMGRGLVQAGQRGGEVYYTAPRVAEN